jgi:hypothetical protein
MPATTSPNSPWDDTEKKKRMWIMIAGPHSSGARTAEQKLSNLERLSRAGLALFEKGQVPIIGVNNALLLIAVAGEHAFEKIMMPLSTALIARCDACLRIGGASKGADLEMEMFERAGKPIYRSVDEIS